MRTFRNHVTSLLAHERAAPLMHRMSNYLPKTTRRIRWIVGILVAFWLTAPALASAAWNEVTSPAVSTTNCITRTDEPLSTSSVGWFGNLTSPPPVNTVYYVRVKWYVTGKPCIGGARVAPELFLPDGSTLAISAANPVKCFAINIQTGAVTPEVAACPQAASIGVRGGLGFYPVGQSYVTWPTAQGYGWEIQVPVLSTTALTGVVNSTNPMVPCPECLTAAVWSIDGVSSPWAYPRVGVRISGSTTTPKITYPMPSVTNVTNTSATGTATLARAGTIGSVFVENSLTPPSGAICNQSSNAIPVTAQDPPSITYPIAFTLLAPGTNLYWRFCYVTGGTTYWGVNQVFRTTGPAPPRILSLLPEMALPGRDVTITGVDLAGATSVTITGAQGPVAATVTGVSANAVTFTVPSVSPLDAFVKVTTPGGTAQSPSVFRVGIDTILDSVTVSASDGGTMQNDVVVRYHSTEPSPSAQYECRLDAGPSASSCDAGVMFYYDLAPGNHSLEIAARAGGWRDWLPLVVPFTIVNSDTTPPNTTLLSGPQWLIASTTATFTFSSSEAGSTFECSSFGAADPPGRWLPCTSPRTVTGLAQGSHFFQVRAKDAAQNVDPTPARTLYEVDTVPPNTILFSVVPPPSSATTTSKTATFYFWGINGGRFQCSLDADPFSACRGQVGFTGLALGSHTFRVRTVDSAGNFDPSPATRTWTIVP